MRTNASLWVQEPLLTPERKVWRAALQQAYEDAELPDLDDGSTPMERTLARRFLRADGYSEALALKRVCDFAAVPCDRVVLWARRNYPLAA